jgi:hypothetical protein
LHLVSSFDGDGFLLFIALTLIGDSWHVHKTLVETWGHDVDRVFLGQRAVSVGSQIRIWVSVLVLLSVLTHLLGQLRCTSHVAGPINWLELIVHILFQPFSMHTHFLLSLLLLALAVVFYDFSPCRNHGQFMILPVDPFNFSFLLLSNIWLSYVFKTEAE